MIKVPDNLFQFIEARVLEQPQLLNQGHWHTRADGQEALTIDEISDPKTAHCLIGWVVAATPGAIRAERFRLDVDEFVNRLLVAAGRLPIPAAFVWEDEESALKLIRGRAAEERIKATQLGQGHMRVG